MSHFLFVLCEWYFCLEANPFELVIETTVPSWANKKSFNTFASRFCRFKFALSSCSTIYIFAGKEAKMLPPCLAKNTSLNVQCKYINGLNSSLATEKDNRQLNVDFIGNYHIALTFHLLYWARREIFPDATCLQLIQLRVFTIDIHNHSYTIFCSL